MKELNDIKKQNPFKVPENYFENLSERIMSQTSATEAGIPKKSIVRRLRPFLAMAASVALFALIGYTAIYYINNPHRRSSSSVAASDKYNSIYLNEIDISTLEENVADNETLIEIPEISRTEIIDYLISEDINILDIYEQL
jgi:vacuolar-type H+-ATPase subunit F/Vma7